MRVRSHPCVKAVSRGPGRRGVTRAASNIGTKAVARKGGYLGACYFKPCCMLFARGHYWRPFHPVLTRECCDKSRPAASHPCDAYHDDTVGMYVAYNAHLPRPPAQKTCQHPVQRPGRAVRDPGNHHLLPTACAVHRNPTQRPLPHPSTRWHPRRACARTVRETPVFAGE